MIRPARPSLAEEPLATFPSLGRKPGWDQISGGFAYDNIRSMPIHVVGAVDAFKVNTADFCRKADYKEGLAETPALSLQAFMGGCRGVAWFLFALLVPAIACGAEPEFDTRIAPLLKQHCVICHGEDSQEGELRVDQLGRDFSDRRAAGRWQDAADRIRTGEMPPKGEEPLPAEDAAAILSWITKQAETAQAGRPHWAFQTVQDVEPPQTEGAWGAHEIDRLIFAKLQAKKLKPSPPADRVTLLRRVTLDLIGLPPTPEETAAFLADDSLEAWERIIDRLLASPHYGERWGRHWLDLAQYADSSGFHNDLDRPYAWKYRDYVIRSLNDDKPYARFVAEQLAGDEVDGANEESFIATGFGRNGPSNDDNMGKTPEALAQYRADQLDNLISTTGTVFLGVTIGCARCHNHKTEPLTSRDYYALLAIFNGTQKHGLVPGTEDAAGKKVEVDPALQIQALVERSGKVPKTFVMRRGLASQRGEEVEPATPVVLTSRPVTFPPPAADAKSSLRRRTLAEWITAPENPVSWRVLANRVWQHHFGVGLVTTPGNFGVSGAEPTNPELLDWLTRRLIEDGGRLKPLHKRILMSATYQQSSAHREDLAQADPANQWLGRMNLRRLEAEILRDSMLAASGKLNRTVGGPAIKPRIREELLSASQRNKWPIVAQESDPHWRRSVYIYSKRQLLMPMLELFDAPTTIDSCSQRRTSVLPTQSLVLMNDEFVEDQAGFLAARITAEAGDDLSQAVEQIFARTIARVPPPGQIQEAIQFVQSREAAGNRAAALADLAHVLFNSSAFLYVE